MLYFDSLFAMHSILHEMHNAYNWCQFPNLLILTEMRKRKYNIFKSVAFPEAICHLHLLIPRYLAYLIGCLLKCNLSLLNNSEVA